MELREGLGSAGRLDLLAGQRAQLEPLGGDAVRIQGAGALDGHGGYLRCLDGLEICRPASGTDALRPDSERIRLNTVSWA
ncbi:hypothetical protein Kosp01_02110 [Kocuria sp. NBRC 114282]|nr:hypothetical protein Kosp01_02110 [Kocuria sp. NBRC 114282]